jgi:hypothetical protein
VHDAFTLAQNGSVGSQYGLRPEDAALVQEWALDKSQRWGVNIGNIKKDFDIAAKADPNLVQEVRSAKAARRGEVAITETQLEAMVGYLEGNYLLQQLTAALVKRYKLSANRTRAAAHLLSRQKDDNAAIKLAETYDWLRIKPELPTSKRQKTTTFSEPSGQKAITPTNGSYFGGQLIKLQTKSGSAADAELAERTLRNAGQEILARNLQLGITTLRALVLSGDYHVPDYRESLDVPRVIVDYSERPDIAALIQPNDAQEQAEQFFKRVDVTQPVLISRFIETSKALDTRRIKAITSLAVEQISDDIEKGGLRYSGPLQPAHYDRILARAVRTELARNRNIEEAKNGKRGRLGAPAVTISSSTVYEHYMNLDEASRMQLALQGFLGLCATTVRQIMHSDSKLITERSSRMRARFDRYSTEVIDFDDNYA